jgi:hypothetical protein
VTQALVSGSAAVAALLRGDMAQLMRYGEDGCIEIPVADLPYVFRDAKDTAKFNQIELDDVERELKLAWSKDRAVRLLEILLSATSSAELRSESADALEELLLLEEAKEYAEFCAYAIPATSNNRNFDTSYLSQLHSVRRLLSDIAKAQPAVEHLRSAWDNLREDLFESDEARASFELAAITRGAFYRLVHSIMSAGSPDEGLNAYCQPVTLARNRNGWVFIYEE